MLFNDVTRLEADDVKEDNSLYDFFYATRGKC